MTATHESYHDKSTEIGSILSSIESIAACGIQNDDVGEMVAMFHACELMAKAANSIAEAIELESMSAQKQEAEA